MNDISRIAESFHTLRPDDREAFNRTSEAVIAYQKRENPVYRAYGPYRYLPIDAFKHGPVTTFDPEQAQTVFRSSGTGSGTRSAHYIRDLEVYHRSLETAFTGMFGDGPFTLIGHLPGYIESGRESSLVYMVERLISRFGNDASGLFLEDVEVLARAARASSRQEPLILFGAAFGLLDLIDGGRAFALPSGSIVIETGGMKTHRRRTSRERLHARISEAFEIPRRDVRSEYGMCELLSQSYTDESGLFQAPAWLDVRVMNPENPDEEVADGDPGVLAVTDLANVYTVSPILTQDRGIRHDGGFEVLGRMSNAELRGCNFLLEDLRDDRRTERT